MKLLKIMSKQLNFKETQMLELTNKLTENGLEELMYNLISSSNYDLLEKLLISAIDE